METIQEDEELIVQPSCSGIDPEPQSSIQEPTFSHEQKDFIAKMHDKIKNRREKLKSGSKLGKTFKKAREEPPKWICTVKGCKWSGRSEGILMAHIKSLHPKQFTNIHPEPYKFINCQQNAKNLEKIVESCKNQMEIDNIQEKLNNL